MPLDDIAGEVLRVTARFIGELLLQIIVEILIKGPGYLICRIFKKEVNSDSPAVLFVGLLFWILVAATIYVAYSHFASAGA